MFRTLFTFLATFCTIYACNTLGATVESDTACVYVYVAVYSIEETDTGKAKGEGSPCYHSPLTKNLNPNGGQ